MIASRRAQIRVLTVVASVSLLFGCSQDSNEAPGIGNAQSALDTALATISRDKIQESLNYLAADERGGRIMGTRGYDESARVCCRPVRRDWFGARRNGWMVAAGSVHHANARR